MAQVTESDYKQAQQGDAKVRQEFLDAIDLEDAREFVKNISYSTLRGQSRGVGGQSYERRMCCSPSYSTLAIFFGRRKIKDKSLIEVCPASFENFSYAFFLSALIDHEGQHARQHVQNFTGCTKIINLKKEKLDYSTFLVELPALYNQKAHEVIRNLSPDERETLDRIISHFTIGLVFSNPLKNPKRDLQAILCNSEGDKLIRDTIIPLLD